MSPINSQRTASKEIQMVWWLASLVIVALFVIYFLVWGGSVEDDTRQFEALNLCILLDLSDRVQDMANMRDPTIIQALIRMFKDRAHSPIVKSGESLGGMHDPSMSQDIFRLLVASQHDANVQAAERNIYFDLGSYATTLERVGELKQKRGILERFCQSAEDSVVRIYQLAQDRRDYPGADIWRFMEYDVSNYSAPIRQDQFFGNYVYRNVLVILTDGYIQFNRGDGEFREQRGNRTSWVRNMNEVEGVDFSDPEWRMRFDSADYGLLRASDKKISDWEIIVLEVRPKNPRSNIEREYVQYWWEKWFRELGVARYLILPQEDNKDVAYILEQIHKFLGNIPGSVGAGQYIDTGQAIKSDKPSTMDTVSIPPAQVTRPTIHTTPNTLSTLSESVVGRMLKDHDLFCTLNNQTQSWANPGGRGLQNHLEFTRDKQIVVDQTTGLMWDNRGSDNGMGFDWTPDYISTLNNSQFGGYSDWRLPTLEEVMSLMKPAIVQKKFINEALSEWHGSIWTSDKNPDGLVWAVRYDLGACMPVVGNGFQFYVHAVRSLK